MKYVINQEFLEPYFKGKKYWKNYYKSVDVAQHIQFHFNGYFQKPWMASGEVSREPALQNPYFMRLIDQRRPTESLVIHAYRRMNYSPITKVPCHKVINSLKKIVKCAEWKIDYSKSENPPSIPDEMLLERYCEEFYPKDNSIENWTYKNLVRWLLIDPNALCVVMPISWDIEPNELLKPYSFIIESKDVYEYKEGELAVFLSASQSTWTDDQGKTHHGKILIVVTADSFYECRQNGKDTFDIVEHPHGCGEMPAWLLGGESKTPDMQQPYYESFIQCMLPSLDDAARDVSDLAAEKNMHTFSTMWYTRMQSCTACQGMGTVLAQGKQVACATCDGTGGITPSPYKAMEINLDNAIFSQKNVPIPPAGYIEKDTAMVTLLREEIKTEIYDALASINMEFLVEKPLNQSGKAKEVDRDELNNFVYGIAYHVVEEIVKNIYWFINEMRYSKLVPNPEMRKKMLPNIPVPQEFDFLSNMEAEDNLIKIAASQVSSELKDLAEMEFLHAKYQDQPEVRGRLMTTHNHNPLGGLTLKEIQDGVTAGLVKKIDAVLSIYISAFVAQLLADNTDFLDLDFSKQKEILYELAQAKLDELDAQEDDGKEQQIMDANTTQVPNDVEDVPITLDNKKLPDKQRKDERDSLQNA